jgi:hypothetical protein
LKHGYNIESIELGSVENTLYFSFFYKYFKNQAHIQGNLDIHHTGPVKSEGLKRPEKNADLYLRLIPLGTSITYNTQNIKPKSAPPEEEGESDC